LSWANFYQTETTAEGELKVEGWGYGKKFIHPKRGKPKDEMRIARIRKTLS